jgi:Mrp family chromosome partitioning ATPase
LVIANPGSSALRAFPTDDHRGLSEFLLGDLTAAEVAQHAVGWQYLDVVPAGSALAEIAERVPMSRTLELVCTFADSGRWVIVEAPPATSGTLARELAQAAGAAVVVVELARTRSNTAAEAVQALERSGANVPGVVAVSRAYARRLVARDEPAPRRRHVRTADANA